MCDEPSTGVSEDALSSLENSSGLYASNKVEEKVPLTERTEESLETQEGKGKEKRSDEFSESEASKYPLEIVNSMDRKLTSDTTKETEKKVDISSKCKEEIHKDVEENKKVEKEVENEKRRSNTKYDLVRDDDERESLENEHTNEMLDDAVEMEKKMHNEAIPHDNMMNENNKKTTEDTSIPEFQREIVKENQEMDKEESYLKEMKEIRNEEKEEVEENEVAERDEIENVKDGKTEEMEEKDEKKKEVNPTRQSCMKETTSTAPKVVKTVNFLESELKARNESKRHTIDSLSPPSSSYKSMKSKEDGDATEEDFQELGEEKERRHWRLGEGNPVYRLSMKLSPNLFNLTDIPGPSQLKEVEKSGFLTKLSGRSFPYIAQWKRRYCVLSKGRLYYYEKEDSNGREKVSGVIQLEYFDQVSEAGAKECKKATNVFIITSQDRSFFDPGRHVFSADTLPDMKDWISKIQAALDQIRNNNRPITPSPATSLTKDGERKRRDEPAETKMKKEIQTQSNAGKERCKKKEESGQATNLSRVDDSIQTRSSTVVPLMCDVDSGRPEMGEPKGGVSLPGLSTHEERTTSRIERSANDDVEGNNMPQARPTLISLTKKRVQGPKGQRAPRRHRKEAVDTALKKRANSLSTLEHQDTNDKREAPWLNRSLDVLGGDPWSRKRSDETPSTKLPYKTYNYSSDEDDMDDNQSDSFPPSASGMLPSPPIRSDSYVPEMTLVSQGSTAPRKHQIGLYSFDDLQERNRDLMANRYSLEQWGETQGQVWPGSQLSIGENEHTSPFMDDLENLLMNESVHNSNTALDSVSDSGSEGSSTCRAADNQPAPAIQHCHHHCNHAPESINHIQQHKKSQDLSRFAIAVKHLQRHVVDINRAVFAVASDVSGTKEEVVKMREAVAALNADAHTITATLSNLTKEAITAQHKVSFATQEVDKVQKIVMEALKDAERAKHEQIRAKTEYLELAAELKVALQVFKDASLGPAAFSAKDFEIDPTPTPVTKSSSNFQVGKGSSTCQSIISKSSSIISGFTNRHSLTKSVFFSDQKEKRKSEGSESKASSLERNKKLDKKEKKDEKFPTTVEKNQGKNKTQILMEKNKYSPVMDITEYKPHHHPAHTNFCLQEGEGKEFMSINRREHRKKYDRGDKRDYVISPLSLEDIPMADDATNEHEATSDPTLRSSNELHIKDGVSPKAFKQTFSITLEQTSTSNTEGFPRSKLLSFNRERNINDSSSSNAYPESLLVSSSSTRPNSILPTLEESPSVSATTSLIYLHQPASISGPQAPQENISSVHKDRVVSHPPQRKRAGKFAISRQYSSPNISLQQQNSCSAFPIRRQQSLGTVPEGRIPRQESLTSVPEDRPLVDRTLPLSPSPSMTYFPISPSVSSSTLSDSARRVTRDSMELVTGPVLAGSSIQEANSTGTLPVLHADDQSMQPAATSTLKRTNAQHSDNLGILV